MKQEFTITLDGVQYPIEAEDGTITVNGRAFAVEVTSDGEVIIDGIAYQVDLGDAEATVDGEVYPFQVEGLKMSAAGPAGPPPAAAPVAAVGTGTVLAIMPGKIIRISVEVGQEVEEGDPVCVLEAMKMENELNARQSGTVRAIHVKPGDDVEKDQVLVEIE